MGSTSWDSATSEQHGGRVGHDGDRRVDEQHQRWHVDDGLITAVLTVGHRVRASAIDRDRVLVDYAAPTILFTITMLLGCCTLVSCSRVMSTSNFSCGVVASSLPRRFFSL